VSSLRSDRSIARPTARAASLAALPFSALVLLLALALAGPAAAVEDTAELMDMSLEDLASLDVEVTSVSKKEQKISEAAAAIAVLTEEDIRRSGATSVPEALRLVPGLEVARIDSNSWAISARGFNSEFANKLLVLIDGRTVYTPLFAGVYWDVQDVVLEDVARIEVIRGPGATVWGANAVNGVINIITKSAEQTQGAMVSVLGGVEEEVVTGTVRYGGSIGDDAHYRVYGRYVQRDDFPEVTATEGIEDGPDEWDQLRTGFRLDWQAGERDHVTVQGDAYIGDSGNRTDLVESTRNPLTVQTVEGHDDVYGGNLLARWDRRISETSGTSLQVYYDRADRDGIALHQQIDTLDVDFQHSFELPGRNSLLWGAGYRWIAQQADDETFSIDLDPPHRDFHLFSAFVQNEWEAIEDLLRITLGSKFEHNDYTGFEVQPSARFVVLPTDALSFWGAWSRAVRTPSWVEDDLNLVLSVIEGGLAPDAAVQIRGDRDVDSEVLNAFEAGARWQVGKRASFDLAAFYNRYDNLVDIVSGGPAIPVNADPVPDYVIVPQDFANNSEGWTAGAELLATWQATDWWRLTAAYTFFVVDTTGDAPEQAGDRDDDARNRVALRSRVNLPWNLELDQNLFFVDEAEGQGVHDFWRLDLRVGWRPTDHVELSLVGQNLNDARHKEFSPGLGGNDTLVPRSAYARATFRF